MLPPYLLQKRNSITTKSESYYDSIAVVRPRSSKFSSSAHACSPVDFRNPAHVLQPFFTWRVRLQIVLDAVREVVRLSRELVRVAREIPFVNPLPVHEPAHVNPVVVETRIEREPAFGPVDFEVAARVGSIACRAAGHNSRREERRPGQIGR